MISRFKTMLAALLIIASLNSQSQNIHKTDVAALIEKARKKYNIPAIAVSLMDSDSIFVLEALGTRVAGTDNPVTLDDYFHIGSCSKSILGVMAGKLIEQEKIKWGTPFFALYPELKSVANKNYHNITLEKLFLCKAGIMPYTQKADNEIFPEIDKESMRKRYDFITFLLQQEPALQANSNGDFKFLYSNASYTMASAMLEKVSGKTYEELVTQTFRDLEFEVFIGWPNAFNETQTWGHLISNKTIEVFPPEHKYKLPSLLLPAGDLSLKPMDYAKYTQLHLKGLRGKDNYLQSETFQYLNFGHEGFSIGIGNSKWAGHRYSGFDGSAGTFFCRSIIIPDTDFAFTIMMNAGSAAGEMKAVNWLSNKIMKKSYNWWWKFWM